MLLLSLSVIIKPVTSREGRVSRNKGVGVVVSIPAVTSREGRVSRNIADLRQKGIDTGSRPARDV